MEKGFYYLAVPYQGTDEEKAARYNLSLRWAAECLKQGIHVFAPILYVNQIVEEMKITSLDQRRELVMPYLFDFLKASIGLIFVNIEGCEKSWGVLQALKFCKERSIPVYRASPDEITGNLSSLLKSPLNQEQLTNLLEVA